MLRKDEITYLSFVKDTRRARIVSSLSLFRLAVAGVGESLTAAKVEDNDILT